MRSLTEYDPYDIEFTFWRERLHVDENNDYIITMLLSDYCLSKAPKKLEFNMAISRPPLGYGNHAQTFSFHSIFTDCLPHSHNPPEDNEVWTPNYYARYIAYRYTDTPFDLLGDFEDFTEKIVDLNSNIVLNRVEEGYRREYWASCDPYYWHGVLVPDHPMVFITERIKPYDLSDNTRLVLRDIKGRNYTRTFYLPFQGTYIHDDDGNVYADRTIIPTPIFPCRRLDFWISNGNSYTLIPFCYAYAPGDAVTEYPYYSYIQDVYNTYHDDCPMEDWREMAYILRPYLFGVGDYPILVYIGFPAIGEDIIYLDAHCFDYVSFLYDLSHLSLHMVLFDPTIIKTDNIHWGV